MPIDRLVPTDRPPVRRREAGGSRQASRQIEAQFELLIDSVEDCAVFLLDEDGCIETWNAGTEQFAGYTNEDVIGEHVSVFYREEDVAAGAPERDLHEARSEGQLGDEGWRVREDGSEFWAGVTTTAFREDDEFAGYVVVMQDLTQRRRERILRERYEQLNEHLVAVSHDVRTPLVVAEGHVQLAEETGDLSSLETATQALDRATELLDHLGMLVEEGERVAEPEAVDLGDVVRAAWAVVETDGAELVVEERVVLLADQKRLQQLLENLLKNAVDHGGPDVTVRVGALDDVGFYVEDDGPGIPESQRADVFEMGTSSVHDGTGFGLPICEQIADAHGWEIELSEGADGGCRFVVSAVERA